MPFNILITFVIGSLLGWFVVQFTRPPSHLHGLIVGCCAAGKHSLHVIWPFPGAGLSKSQCFIATRHFCHSSVARGIEFHCPLIPRDSSSGCSDLKGSGQRVISFTWTFTCLVQKSFHLESQPSDKQEKSYWLNFVFSPTIVDESPLFRTILYNLDINQRGSSLMNLPLVFVLSSARLPSRDNPFHNICFFWFDFHVDVSREFGEYVSYHDPSNL